MITTAAGRRAAAVATIARMSFTTPLPISRTRRRAAVLTAAATVAICAAAVLAWWNPRGYVGLDTGLLAPVVVATVLPVAAAALVLLLARTRAAAITVSIVCGVLALVALCGGGAVALWTDPGWQRAVLATSPSGDYQVVTLTDDSLTWRQELRIAHPDGVLSRESKRPVACVTASFGDTPKARVTSARFVAEHEVELTLDDGTTWRTPFDPGTLRPSQTLRVDC